MKYGFYYQIAHWQLEQCITWLENLDPKHSTLAKMMREAMRPQ